MTAVLTRLLGMNARELRRAIPLFLYLFLTMAGTVASKAARDALFLERFRAVDLPYADIAIAVIVGVVASAYIRVGQRLNLRNLQVGSLALFAVSTLGFWWWSVAPGEESPALFLAIYIWVGVLSVLAPAQVWTLANFVLTTREAKRAVQQGRTITLMPMPARDRRLIHLSLAKFPGVTTRSNGEGIGRRIQIIPSRGSQGPTMSRRPRR